MVKWYIFYSLDATRFTVCGWNIGTESCMLVETWCVSVAPPPAPQGTAQQTLHMFLILLPSSASSITCMHLPSNWRYGRKQCSWEYENACDKNTRLHLSLSLYVFHVCHVCSHAFCTTMEGINTPPAWGVNAAPRPFFLIKAELRVCRNGKANRMWLPLSRVICRLLRMPVAILICHRI